MKKKPNWEPGDSHWEEDWAKALEENNVEHFGHNTDVEKKYFRKMENLGAGYAEITIEDEYTATVKLPPDLSQYRENVLLFVLTTSPLPSECRYNKNKDTLTLEWHY